MAKRFPFRFVLVALFAVFMLAMQYVVDAHQIGHAGAERVSASSGKGSDDGGALGHACLTCVAFAGLLAGPPASMSPLFMAHVVADAWVAVIEAAPDTRFFRPYPARAPPIVL